MPITDREAVQPGTLLHAQYKGADRYALCVKRPDGGLGFVLDTGKAYKSPSAAGAAVRAEGMEGEHANCNGWVFWTVIKPAPGKITKPLRAKAKKVDWSKLVRPVPAEAVAGRKQRAGKAKPASTTVAFLPA